MSEFIFRPIPLISGLDDQEAFRAGWPDLYHWLTGRAIPYRLSVYRWPEILARLLGNRLGTTIYEITVQTDHYAEIIKYDDDA
jgi:hypothetical protein